MKPYLILYLTIISLTTFETFGQNKPGTLLWEISGNGLDKKSYIFGTNHLFDGTWLDSFTVVKDKLLHSELVVGEMLSPQKRIAARQELYVDTLNRKGFDQLFSREEYILVDTYMQSIGLSSLDKAPKNDPSVVPRVFYAILGHQIKKQLFIKNNGKGAIDFSIERFADESSKPFIGLDQLDSLIVSDNNDALPAFGNETLGRGIIEMVEDIGDGGTNTNAMIGKTKGAFSEWSDLKVRYSLKKNDPDRGVPEIKKLSIERTERWLKHLPDIIKTKSSFIAVGLRHLKYKQGIISRLRELGYTVRPIPMERKHSL